ncbi:hypothetical protein INR49_031024 [Caranx melampygus]|nr:hypothetical protein INR49_031024 [Caranx melampygus]
MAENINHSLFFSLKTSDVTHIYTEPLILRTNGTPERLLDSDGDNCNNSFSHSELITPSKSITFAAALCIKAKGYAIRM